MCWMQQKQGMSLRSIPSTSPAITLAGSLQHCPWSWIRGVSKAGTFLTDMIKKYHDELSPMATKKADIVLAKLGNDAGIYGAAKLILG